MLGGLTIVSGGQTGVDRTALDVAIAHGLPYGGWCPRGRLAEDGQIPEKYANLREMPTRAYPARTRQNVVDSDGTVIFAPVPWSCLPAAALEGGTKLTADLARAEGRPFLLLPWNQLAGTSHDKVVFAARDLRNFINAHHVGRLNVAGPRLSKSPAHFLQFVADVLNAAI